MSWITADLGSKHATAQRLLVEAHGILTSPLNLHPPVPDLAEETLLYYRPPETCKAQEDWIYDRITSAFW